MDDFSQEDLIAQWEEADARYFASHIASEWMFRTADESNGVLPTTAQKQKKTRAKFRIELKKKWLRLKGRMKRQIKRLLKIKRKKTPKKKYEEKARKNPQKVERKPAGGATSWSDYKDKSDYKEQNSKREQKDRKKKWEDTPQAKKTRKRYEEKRKHKNGGEIMDITPEEYQLMKKQAVRFKLKSLKTKVFKSLKRRNPGKARKNKLTRKRKRRQNMGAYIRKKIKAKRRLKLPIVKLRNKIRSTFKRKTKLKSLKRGMLLTSPEILVGIVPKIDVIDQTVKMAVVHNVSPLTGMVTFLMENSRLQSIPLEVFLEIAVPMSEEDEMALANLIFAELGDLEYIPVSRQEALDCASSLINVDDEAQCLDVSSDMVNESLGVDSTNGVSLKVKSQADEFRRSQSDWHKIKGLPLMQEPAVFGQIFYMDEDEPAEKEASFYREQQHPHQMGQNWNKKDKDKGTPEGDDERETNKNPTWVVPQTGAPYNQETGGHPPTQGLTQPAVYNNPGSAKVIPSGHGFVNKEGSQPSPKRVARRYFNAKNSPHSR